MDYELEKLNIKLTILKTFLICLTLAITLIYSTNLIVDTIEFEGCKSRMSETISNQIDITDISAYVESSENLIQELCEFTSN